MDPGEGSGGEHTRARSWGDTARTRGFGVRRLPDRWTWRPHSLRARAWGTPDWGHLTLAPSSSPFPSGSLAFPAHPAAALRVRLSLGLLRLGLWEDRKLRVCFERVSWFIPRGKALTPVMQTLISALLDVGLMGRLGVGGKVHHVWGQFLNSLAGGSVCARP